MEKETLEVGLAYGKYYLRVKLGEDVKKNF